MRMAVAVPWVSVHDHKLEQCLRHATYHYAGTALLHVRLVLNA